VTSIFGPVEAGWSVEPSALTMTLSLPPNTGGEIVVPAPAKPATSVVMEGGRVVWRRGAFVAGASDGVLNGSSSADGIHLFVGSGDYSFAATL
jgi:hypothetical protein